MQILAPDFITKCATSQKHALRVFVIGCGGTGSEVASKLFKMNATLRALGNSGLDVTLIDDDFVSPSNIGRQAFFGFDVGQPKASVLANRFNNFGGTKWRHIHRKFEEADLSQSVVFGCVDNAVGRKNIHKCFARSSDVIWIDSGNDSSSANVLMGVNAKVHGNDVYIPSVYDLFKTQLDTAPPSMEPSCSTSEAVSRQDFGINDATAQHAVQMLWQLYRHGVINYQGMTVDLKSGVNAVIEADPDNWAMFGYTEKIKRKKNAKAA